MTEKPSVFEWCIYALAALGLHVAVLALALAVRAWGMR